MFLAEKHKLRLVSFAGQQLHAGPGQLAVVENHRVTVLAKRGGQSARLFVGAGLRFQAPVWRAREKNREERSCHREVFSNEPQPSIHVVPP